MRGAFSTFGLCVAILYFAATAKGDGPVRPNVLFIAVDDLNDWVGFLGGHPGTKTPNLDRLAKRGMIFTRAYCNAPLCNPSRASLLCGIRPSTSGVYQNNQPWRPALPTAVTLPQQFSKGGYEVAGGGKIFHGSFNDPASWPTYVKTGPHPAPKELPANGIPRTGHFDWGPLSVGDEAMGDARVVDWAVDFLSKKHDRPFFLAVGLIRPHLPWFVPKAYFDRHPLEQVALPTVKADDLSDVPPAGIRMAKPEGDHHAVVSSNNWEKGVQAYLASITFADAMIGRVLDALDRSPHGRDTAIVLWGDHGWNLGEKRHWRKFALWEETTRVPLIVVAPGVVQPGSTCERTVTLLDLYPTLVDLCALPPRSGLEGVSLMPLLREPSVAWDHPAVTTYGRDNHAVRDERTRYIRYADGSEELYDHRVDPHEWTNVASKPEYAAIKAGLAKSLPTMNAPPVPARGGADPD